MCRSSLYGRAVAGLAGRVRHPLEGWLLGPVTVEGFAPLLDRWHLVDIDGALARDHDQGLQDGGVAAPSSDQGSADRRQDMGAVGEHVARLGKVAAAQKFQ